MERYSDAASLKRELDDLCAADVVSDVLNRLDTALEEERYADAAALRDGGLTSLAGWWAGRADGDPIGHLLHIAPEYGRWTGRALRSRDIAELKVGRSSGGGGGDAAGGGAAAGRASGQPVLEVFLRDGGGGDPRSLTHQA
eukprot:359650-Chlamydomonas_euryale.AAC.21